MKANVGTQSYSWFQIYQELGKNHREHLDEIFAQVREAGIEMWEGWVESEEDAAVQKKLLDKHGLRMRSIYVGSQLHTADWEKSVERIVRQSHWAKAIGVEVVVTNPNPINGDKTDDQLKTQAHALDVLGGQLASQGIQLAYHTHTPEMKNAAREFHHMMLGTDPGHLGLCLDAHWVFRGAGDSQVALYDIVKLYAFRIREVHLRQSKAGVWTEALGEGDIDYKPLAALLNEMDFAGPLIIEQCVEKGTPRGMSGVERQKLSRQYVKKTFGI